MISGVYGTAAFQPGQEEVDTNPLAPATSPAIVDSPDHLTPVAPAVIATPGETEIVDTTTVNEGLSLTQKALFLAFIFGAVAVYVRMNTRSSSRGAYSRV